jgi:predicted membrane chloride channel (bestrophin family)
VFAWLSQTIRLLFVFFIERSTVDLTVWSTTFSTQSNSLSLHSPIFLSLSIGFRTSSFYTRYARTHGNANAHTQL